MRVRTVPVRGHCCSPAGSRPPSQSATVVTEFPWWSAVRMGWRIYIKYQALCVAQSRLIPSPSPHKTLPNSHERSQRMHLLCSQFFPTQRPGNLWVAEEVHVKTISFLFPSLHWGRGFSSFLSHFSIQVAQSLCSHSGRIMQIPMKCHGPRAAQSFFWMQTDHTAITGLWLLGTLWTCSFLFLLFQTHRLPGLWQSHSPENALPVGNNKTISYVICTTSGISCQGQKCEMGLTFWMTSL